MIKTYKGHDIRPDNSCAVYWIHAPEHSDVFTEGYVGVTSKPPKERWNSHIYERNRGARRGRPLSKAILESSHLIFEVIAYCSDYQQALDMEAKLRPDIFIGWNTMRGANVIDPLLGGLLNGQRIINEKKKSVPGYLTTKQRAEQRRWEVQQRQERMESYKDIFEHLLKPQVLHRKANKCNKTGIKGVTWFERYEMWRVQARIDNVNICIRYTPDLQVAESIAIKANAIRFQWLLNEITTDCAIIAIKALRN